MRSIHSIKMELDGIELFEIHWIYSPVGISLRSKRAVETRTRGSNNRATEALRISWTRRRLTCVYVSIKEVVFLKMQVAR